MQTGLCNYLKKSFYENTGALEMFTVFFFFLLLMDYVIYDSVVYIYGYQYRFIMIQIVTVLITTEIIHWSGIQQNYKRIV